jgi:hypothetical protein
MSSNKVCRLDPEHQRRLVEIAWASIEHGLTAGDPLRVVPDDFPEALREHRSTFVTLRIGMQLRGCMGSLEATEPLVINVARNAFSAAFHDPRFPRLTPPEFPRLRIHLSLLTRPEPIEFKSEAELLSRIRPGVDGLTLHEGARRATLLPAVWDTVATAEDFLIHLKRKAGLSLDYWSPTIRLERYETESISGEE